MFEPQTVVEIDDQVAGRQLTLAVKLSRRQVLQDVVRSFCRAEKRGREFDPFQQAPVGLYARMCGTGLVKIIVYPQADEATARDFLRQLAEMKADCPVDFNLYFGHQFLKALQ